VVEKLPRILMMNNSDLIHMTLKLLLNLSFTLPLRERMVRVGFLPKLVSLLSKYLTPVSSFFSCKAKVTLSLCMPLMCMMEVEV
jgi:hypothetical protein